MVKVEGINPGAAPSGTGCVECLADGGWWLHLRRCAECGHIGCCDSSPMRHARKHYGKAGGRAMIEPTAHGQHEDLRGFLKRLRKRLDPAAETLGAYKRLSYKRGRAVSQEELAEAVDVSRGWYALLESGGSVQPSVALLNRLAGALNATPDERGTLFRLAIPALHDGLAHESRDSVASLSLIRAASSRLCSVGSGNEALSIAAEYAANWFNDAVLIVSAMRTEGNSWEWNIALNRGSIPNEQVSPHLCDLPFLQERIVAPNEFHGFIHVRHSAGHIYSEFDRAVLAAIADIASLALS